MRWGDDAMAGWKPPPDDEPWQARALSAVLTERGLGTLLSIVLVGFLVWGGYRLISDVREVGQAQIAQQERIIVRLDEALEHLKRIEALLGRAGGAVDFADVSAELERVNGRLVELERAGGKP